MDHFHIEDKFYYGLEDFIEELEQDYEENLTEMPDDWTERVELSELNPIFEVKGPKELLEIFYDRNEERFPEESERTDKEILKAFEESIDFDKLNSLLPKLYYGNGKFVTITKKDLLDFINPELLKDK